MPENITERLDSGLSYAESLERYLRQVAPDGPTEPRSDRETTGPLRRGAMDRPCQIVYGRVVDAISPCHWYKVQPEGGRTTIPCCMLSGTALTPFGVREHNQLHPNAGVYLLLHPSSPYGAIIGVEPPHQYDGTRGLGDYVSLASANTIQTEQVHSFPFTLPKNGTIVDWSGNRPLDGTSAGEWGMFCETGVALFIDSAMAFLRADEDTGFWAFYGDQLARVSGHNLQIRATGGWEVEALDDQGEFNHTVGFTPYPWEQMGALAPGTAVHREVSATARQTTEPHYSKYEPLFDDQQPFHRTRHYHGYLGQGGKRQVVAPPVGATGVNRYSDRAPQVGLFDETVSATGAWTVRSATGLRLLKRSLVPAAKQVRRPEDTGGDSPNGYRAAGIGASGPDHAVGPVTAGGPDPQMTRVCAAVDLQTYAVNWEGQVGFHYHVRDYDLPNESALSEALGPGAARLPFSNLIGTQRLTPPDPRTVRVDHRYLAVPLYPVVSYVELSDDGSVLIGDGSGSEIRMAGGTIEIASAGDLVLAPGRNLVVRAGRDVSVRAKRHLEAATTEGDVRIASGRHAEYSAARGLLVESRSETRGWDGWRDAIGSDVTQDGLHFKAANSSVCTWADFVYVRAGVEGGGGGMYLDSGGGTGTIETNAAVWRNWVGESFEFGFGTGSAVRAVYKFGAEEAMIGAPTRIVGALTTSGSVTAGDSLYAVRGHVSTFQSASEDGKVGELADRALSDAEERIQGIEEDGDRNVTDGGSAFEAVWTAGLYAANSCGDPQTIADVTASFLTSSQYGTEGYRFYEARWQQMARLWGSQLTPWVERPVSKSGTDTYPYPGAGTLLDPAAYLTLDPVLFDFVSGVAKDRTDPAYITRALDTPSAGAMNQSYTVVG